MASARGPLDGRARGFEFEVRHRDPDAPQGRVLGNLKDRLLMAVGIFDSGLGGLTVLDAVARRLPDTNAGPISVTTPTRPTAVRDADDIYDLTTKGACRLLFDEGCDLG